MEFKFLRHVWSDIRQGHNIELYFTVLLCLIVIVLGALDIADPKVVTSAILAVLSLEAMSLLENRRTQQGLKQSLEKVLERQGQYRLSDILSPFGDEMQELNKRLGQADEVWILSRTCRRLWADNRDEFQTVAQRGGLKLLLVDPNNGALDMIAKSAVWQQPDDNKRLKDDVKRFANQLKYIQGELHLSNLEVKFIDYLPAWTLILIDPAKNDGVIYVELATYRSHSRKRPCFVVKCDLDNSTFNLFLDDFKEMWKAAKLAWEPES